MEVSKRAAVLGFPVEHSLSPVLHNAGYAACGLSDWEYGRFECTAEQLPDLVSGMPEEYKGFSVTMPAKFAALDFATEKTDRAHSIGSANTLVRTSTGWRADNTDCDGVLGALNEMGVVYSLAGAQAIVVGGGGTARPALWTLAKLGVSHIVVVNRTDKTDELLPILQPFGINYNVIPYASLTESMVKRSAVVISTVPSAVINDYVDVLAHAPVLDVIYDPWPTPLVAKARARGLDAVGGHVMLAHQAYKQFEEFTGRPAPRDAMWEALLKSLN